MLKQGNMAGAGEPTLVLSKHRWVASFFTWTHKHRFAVHCIFLSWTRILITTRRTTSALVNASTLTIYVYYIFHSISLKQIVSVIFNIYTSSLWVSKRISYHHIISYLSHSLHAGRNLYVWMNVFYIPVKVLAVQFFSQLFSWFNVAIWKLKRW